MNDKEKNVYLNSIMLKCLCIIYNIRIFNNNKITNKCS